MNKTNTKETETEIEKSSVENKAPIGILFDVMNYYSTDDLDYFISNMSQEQAMFCILEASKSAFKRNTYNLLESEVLSKALRIISK